MSGWVPLAARTTGAEIWAIQFPRREVLVVIHERTLKTRREYRGRAPRDVGVLRSPREDAAGPPPRSGCWRYVLTYAAKDGSERAMV